MAEEKSDLKSRLLMAGVFETASVSLLQEVIVLTSGLGFV